MIVIETKLNIEQNGQMSFEAHVLAVTKNADGTTAKFIFETDILPPAMKQIENEIKQTKFFNPSKYSEFIAKLLNYIVATAKIHKYRLKRLGQSEEHILMNQLEFVEE